MNIVEFIKKNKVATIATSCVLVAAIAGGVAFGVINHKNKIESSFTPNGSGNGTSVSVPPIEDNSSETDDSSEASSVASGDTIEVTSTPSKTETTSSSSVTSSKPSNSTTSTSSTSTTSTASKPTTSNNAGSSSSSSTGSSSSTPSTGNNGGSTGGGTTGWVCPDPSAHPEKSETECISQHRHDSFVAQHQNNEANKDTPTADPDKCWICGRPFGDGYNGTCKNFF